MGCRSVAGSSLLQSLKLLGIKGRQLERATKNIFEAAGTGLAVAVDLKEGSVEQHATWNKAGTEDPQLGRLGEGA